MPELPEVETIKGDLQKNVIRKRIINIKVNFPKLIKLPEPSQFIAHLQGNYIKGVKREGKYILFFLNSAHYFVIHLGMSGRLLYQSNPLALTTKKKKHDHIIFLFEDRSRLTYNDVRKFGKVWLLSKEKKLPVIEFLGFDPLSPKFTLDEFTKLLQGSHGNIKSLIMNQKKIAGIGNIYANEILFYARINPLRKANSLTRKEAENIFLYIRVILSKAIQLRGTTMSDDSYRDLDGNRGKYEAALMVYGKKKEKCPFCGQPLEVVRIENRSTFFCSACQR